MAASVKKVLLVAKGHPYEREPFYAVFDRMEGVEWTLVEQPAARALFTAEHAEAYDAFVMYDMPGVRFDPRPGVAPEFETPDETYIAGFEALLDAGVGLVFLHHAIAGWPAWPRYADILGGRFLYQPGTLRGRTCPDSGYRHSVTHTVSTVGEHPVLEGIPSSFEITDELYLYQVFEEDVTPLLVSDHAFVEDEFYSASLAVKEGQLFSREGWTHTEGSSLIGWTRQEKNSRIVYLQCGDDPVAYEHPCFGRLIENAIDWVSA